MVKDGCLYLYNDNINKRSDNTYVLFPNNKYAHIVKFIVDKTKQKQHVLVNRIETKNTFENNHSKFQMFIKIEDNRVAVTVADTKAISVCINVNNKQYICAVPKGLGG